MLSEARFPEQESNIKPELPLETAVDIYDRFKSAAKETCLIRVGLEGSQGSGGRCQIPIGQRRFVVTESLNAPVEQGLAALVEAGPEVFGIVSCSTTTYPGRDIWMVTRATDGGVKNGYPMPAACRQRAELVCVLLKDEQVEVGRTGMAASGMKNISTHTSRRHFMINLSADSAGGVLEVVNVSTTKALRILQPAQDSASECPMVDVSVATWSIPSTEVEELFCKQYDVVPVESDDGRSLLDRGTLRRAGMQVVEFAGRLAAGMHVTVSDRRER